MAVSRKRRNFCLSCAIITLLTVVAYLPTFSGEFILDDRPLVEGNAYVREFQSLTSYLAQEDGVTDGERGGQHHTGYYRPLVNVTYAADYKLWGMKAGGFRATNLILHLLTCCLFFQTLIMMGGDRRAAFMAALLFSLHPVNTETVSWITSRNNILVSFFGLAAIYLYVLAWERSMRKAFLLSVLSFGAAVASKEFGLMVLPVIFIYHRLSLSEKGNFARECLFYVPFLLTAGLYLLFRSHVTGALFSPSEGGDLWQRVFLVPYLIAWNLRLMLMPYGLHSFIVHYPPTGLGWQALTGLFCMALLGLFLWRERRDKFLLFSSLAVFLTLFPVLNIIRTSAVSLISMRWLYFPLIFFFLGLTRYLERWLRKSERLTWIMIGVLVLYLGAYSHVLNRQLWHDEDGFFRQEVLHFKNTFYSGGLAENLLSRGKYREAEPYFEQAIAGYPSSADNYVNYSALLLDTGRPGAALSLLRKAESLPMTRKKRGEWFNNAGMAHFSLRNWDDALKSFRKAVVIHPEEPGFWCNLGGAYGSLGAYGKAVDALQKGLKIAPDSDQLRENLALTHMKMGDYEKAIGVLEEIPPQRRERNRNVMRLLGQAREKSSIGRE
jgi:tetratricopeptide (TPR) repeat protein